MAFTFEVGTGTPGANAYIEVSFADTHHGDRGNSAWNDFTNPEKQAAIIRGSEYVDKRFGRRFVGIRKSKEQGLEWPRLDAFDSDGFLLSGVDDLPRQLEKAVAEYALRAAICGTLAPDAPLPVPKQDLTDSTGTRPDQVETGQLTRKREKVGPLEEDKWFETTSQVIGRNLAAGATGVKSSLVNDFLIPEYPEADMWLEELLRSSMNVMLARGD
jgi:hypothetical protein